LSSHFDPEDLSGIVRTYQDTCAGVVSHYDGYIARYMGDGMLVYFGYPHAHEDDAERALHAGLEIIARVRQLEPRADLSLQTRIGVATGLVVVGETVGENTAKEQVVMGETPNLAARLQSVAEPDQLVVASSTRHLCGNVFDFQDLDERSLKGFSEPVATFAVLGERSVESRFDAHRSQRLESMVGRDQELALLLQRWRSAVSGEGQVVVLSGEAGIGKSRIVRAIIDAATEDDHFRISYQCSPYHGDSALYPAIRQLGRAAGFASEDDDDAKLDKLEALLSFAKNNKPETNALIAGLLGLDGERFAKLDLTPQQQRIRTLEALLQQLVTLSLRKPVLFVVEDAHWIDATTLEFIELCLDPTASARILFVITARPTFDYNFGGHPVVTGLTLNRLGREQINGLIEHITKGKSLPVELRDEIVVKTDGVPLFVEELTKTVLESGALTETEHAWILEGSLKQLAIPTSLHDSLMARLDRLNRVKEVAQTAACIGREFDYTLLATVSPLAETELNAALDQLISAELVFGRGVPPNASYTFKHALVRDAAYESLLKSVRQHLHGRIMQALDEIDAPPELLAHHAEFAGETEQAIDWWQQAGETAFARPAYEESIGHLSAAIRLVQQMGDDESSTQRELTLQVPLAQALLAKRGYAARPTAEAFERALALTEIVGETEFRIPVQYGTWVVHYVRGEHEQALQRALRLLELAQPQEDSIQGLVANRVASPSYMVLGKFTEAKRHLETALRIYDPQKHSALANHLGSEPGATLNCYMALVLWILGYPDQAATHANRAIVMARESAHVNTLCFADLHVAMFAYFGGDVQLGRRHGESLVEIAGEHDMTFWGQLGELLLAWEFVSQGNESGIHRFRDGFESYIDSGSRALAPVLAILFVSQLLRLDRTEEASRTIADVRRVVQATGECWAAAELHRVEGDLYLRRSDEAQARVCYEHAIETARSQSARSWELRATTSLAALLSEQGEKQRARDLLEGIYGWFSEGLESHDLKDAKSLLDRCS
jgi:predicted ATPase/class 3 adenylate cyclase